MPLQCGIVGLPNVGKSSLFNALTASAVPAANYPFCTIDPNIGAVAVPDPRLEPLVHYFRPKRITSATVEFVDIAGLVKGAHKGGGLGNQFLGQIRQVTAIIHVIRCFHDPNVVHLEGDVDPIRDAQVIETELLMADLETIGRRLERAAKGAKGGDKKAREEADLFQRVQAHCNAGEMARTFGASGDEEPSLAQLGLLTRKPILYVANVDESEIVHTERSGYIQALFDFAKQEGNVAIRLCARLEQELAQVAGEEKRQFLAEYHLPEPGLDKLIHAAYRLLGLETFFTGGPTEVRAWTIRQGATAYEAAGEIHTDFQRGFIRAEVYHFDDLVRHGSEAALREAGKIRLEGREYRVQDGDVIFFRFNV